MVHLQYDIACCISVLFILSLAKANVHDHSNPQRRTNHLPGNNEYSEFSDNDERDKGSSYWNQMQRNVPKPPINIDKEQQVSHTLAKNIEWDSEWAKNIKFGQVSAVSIDPNGNIAIFHRGSRVWGSSTFNIHNVFNKEEGPIPEDTIILLRKSGKMIAEWGSNKFYLPHGLTIDMYGNYWITDVALHQVFKFNAGHVRMMNGGTKATRDHYMKMYERELRPTLTLGEAFVPGNDDKRFCKPTAVAVDINGDFFVSDGYCNSRIVKFNADGERILHWGRGSTYGYTPLRNTFNVPHALALASKLDLLFVADRENGRILSFYAANGTFHKEYKNLNIIGPFIYSVAYAEEKLYFINGRADSRYNIHVRGFVLDVNSGDILSQFGPGQDMDSPHDIAVSPCGSEIYVVELNKNITYKFSQKINMAHADADYELEPLTDPQLIHHNKTFIIVAIFVIIVFVGTFYVISHRATTLAPDGTPIPYHLVDLKFSKIYD
ncbi:peptidyl-alpha-hydroxyglycine alpha-amidating lyase 1-like [Bombus pascuorum]|uniref:peptidyl-alpha-hydroxyglycine alpha-amidating lyase 1-like n=1 Tax=Bombus pascuorum TaxID=65598 RepID=UPI002145D971|nr:peptidyl-alpha-hydroxyglycine alpha-amidating lyase 1-like [Bombus pascuorum]